MTTFIKLGEKTYKDTLFDALRIKDSAESIEGLLRKKIIDENTATEISQNIGSIKIHTDKLSDWAKHWNKRVQEVV
jgi:hypothetical protein